MQLARVLGNATATVKHVSLQGMKILIVHPQKADGKSADGFPVLAADNLGASYDQLVLVTSDGASARRMLNNDKTPVRWTVIGLRD